MRRFVALFIILGLGYWYYTKPKQVVLADGTRQITVQSNGFKAVLSVGEPVAEGYVLFGASNGAAFGDAILSGLPQRAAKRLYRDYPDLDRCNSAGNAELQRGMERFNVVALDRSLKGKLAEAMDDVRRREGTASTRVCVKVRGKALGIVSLERMGAPISYDDSVLNGHTLIDTLDIVECSVLLN